jgi:Amt family ammonium transporter
VTPAAGYIDPMYGLPIGIVSSLIGYYCILLRTKRMKVDESLDVWAVHGMGGIWGTLAVGIFATLSVNANGADGLVAGNGMLMLKQLAAVSAIGIYAFVVTFALAKLVKATMGLRVKDHEEIVGLDISQHGERAYGGMSF